MQKLLTKFQGLAASGRHNSAMITDRRKYIVGCLVSIFTVRINSKSSGLYVPYKKGIYQIFGTV